MRRHYCSEHDTEFFKKGRMRGYAHPIGETGEWCNEPEESEASALVEEAKSIEAKEIETTQKVTDPKNRSYALSYAKDLAVAGKIEVKDIGAYAKKYTKYLDTGE